MSTHKNSKIVTIKKSSAFYSPEVKYALSHLFNQGKVSIGSYFQSKTSSKIARGLEDWECIILLPQVLSMPANHYEFWKAVDSFYKQIRTRIPKDGLDLEVGLMQDNNKEISETNLPLNLSDYIAYRHLLKHPMVAHSEREAKSNSLKKFYIFDKNSVIRDDIMFNELKDKATLIYLEIKDNPIKVEQVLSGLGVDINSLSKEDKILKLKELSEKRPIEFKEVSEDKLLEAIHFVNELIYYSILVKEGVHILTNEEKTDLGTSVREVALSLEDKKNTNLKAVLMARYKTAKS